MLALKDAKWVSSLGWGYDMHNPAPLWLAMQDIEPDCRSFTYREDINDHSNFSRRSGKPNSVDKIEIGPFSIPVASPEAIEIQSSSFAGDDRYPVQRDLTDMFTGGFVQVQDLDPKLDGSDPRVCLNIWSPAKVMLENQPKNTFTLRNRLFDIPVETKDDLPVQWNKWNGPEGVTLLRIAQNHEGKFSMSSYKLGNSKTQLVTYDKDKSWAVTQTPDLINVPLLNRPLNTDSGRWKLSRFLVGNFASSDPNSMDVVTVCFDEVDAVNVSLLSLRTLTYIEPWNKPLGDVIYVKQFATENSRNSVAIASINTWPEDSSQLTLDVDLVQAASYDGIMTRKNVSTNFPVLEDTYPSNYSLLVKFTPSNSTYQVAMLTFYRPEMYTPVALHNS